MKDLDPQEVPVFSTTPDFAVRLIPDADKNLSLFVGTKDYHIEIPLSTSNKSIYLGYFNLSLKGKSHTKSIQNSKQTVTLTFNFGRLKTELILTIREDYCDNIIMVGSLPRESMIRITKAIQKIA